MGQITYSLWNINWKLICTYCKRMDATNNFSYYDIHTSNYASIKSLMWCRYFNHQIKCYVIGHKQNKNYFTTMETIATNSKLYAKSFSIVWNHACKWMHLLELNFKNFPTSCIWNDNAPRHKNVHETIKKSKLRLEHVSSYCSNHLMNFLEYYWVCGCKNNKRSHKVCHNHFEL